MNSAATVLFLLGTGLAVSPPLLGQQSPPLANAPRISVQPVARPMESLVAVPDSVRERVGYQHWKGAAIGGGVGPLGGLVLALAAHGQCADCTSNTPPIAKTTLVGAGLGGAFGFLVGLASPCYRRVERDGY